MDREVKYSTIFFHDIEKGECAWKIYNGWIFLNIDEKQSIGGAESPPLKGWSDQAYVWYMTRTSINSIKYWAPADDNDMAMI